jgi:hypothetical protein
VTAELPEVVAARAMLADFQRAMHEYTTGTATEVDALSWALRLSQHMQQLVAVMTAPPAASTSHVAADGSAWLSAADLATVLEALDDARRFTAYTGYGDLALLLGGHA